MKVFIKKKNVNYNIINFYSFMNQKGYLVFLPFYEDSKQESLKDFCMGFGYRFFFVSNLCIKNTFGKFISGNFVIFHVEEVNKAFQLFLEKMEEMKLFPVFFSYCNYFVKLGKGLRQTISFLKDNYSVVKICSFYVHFSNLFVFKFIHSLRRFNFKILVFLLMAFKVLWLFQFFLKLQFFFIKSLNREIVNG